MIFPEIITLGEALIDITSITPGRSILTNGEMYMTASGAPAIVAAALARMGTKTGFIGRVGADFFGYHLRDTLDKLGVDTSTIVFDPVVHTGLAFVNWDERSNAQYLFYRNPSADMLLQPEDINIEYLSHAHLLQFGSLLLASEPSASATRKALEVCRKAGILLSYDLNLRVAGWADEAAARTGVTFPLEFANIVKLNRNELTFLTGISDPEVASKLLWRENFKLLIVTLDNEGSFFRTSSASGFVPGFKVKAIDTIGAGDGFMAGLLDELNRGKYVFEDTSLIKRACRQGNAVGALMVTRQGAIPALPSREEVDRLLKQ